MLLGFPVLLRQSTVQGFLSPDLHPLVTMPMGGDSEQTAIFHWDTSCFLHSEPSLNKPLRRAKQGGLIHWVSFFHGVWGVNHGEKQQQLFAKCLLLPEPHGRHLTFNLSLIIKRPPR